MIYPKEFLEQLDRQHNKITYARITALSFDEKPLQEIEGNITSGSISLDGASAIRRTCQISMVTNDIDIGDYYWTLKTKFKLAIGVENHIDNNYPDIIWFEQGIYIITSFNSSYNTNSYTINISGKDKMCLLNGEIAGSISSSVDFGTIEQEYSKGVWKKIKLPVKDIIREMVHTYAGEPFHNIIINDLETYGMTLQEYRYSDPMFLLREVGKNNYFQGFIDQNVEVLWNGVPKTLAELNDKNSGFNFETLQEDFVAPPERDTVRWPVEPGGGQSQYQCTIAKIDYGETAGYTEGNLVYPDELIANIGESITSVLDKIKNFLGEFEYFYNIQGQFIFQKKKSYVSTDWSPIKKDSENKTYIEDLRANEGIAYNFSGSEFFTAFNNTPNIVNLKNDFTVWGTRKETNGDSLPIHMRYALDDKPTQYTIIEVADDELTDYNIINHMNLKGQKSITYVASDVYDAEKNENSIYCDWRELIYRMALDYNKYNHLDDFETKVAAANPQLYPIGKTGYEQYYIDLQGFWRQLYYPFLPTDISELKDKIENEDDPNKKEDLEKQLKSKEEQLDAYYLDYDNSAVLYGWAKAVYEQPETLLFWFDFMDTNGNLQQYSVPALGTRPKVTNNNQVKAIYYRETPNVIFQSGKVGGEQTGYRYFNVPSALSMFSKSAQGIGAKEEIDNLLYNHSYCIESVNITSIPVYYLDTNTRIYINDLDSGIEGEYIVSKISMQLSYNGTMSITATKAAQRLL